MESLFFTLFSGAVVLNFHITPSTADDKDRQFVSLDLAITLPHKVQRYTHKNLAPLSFLHHFVCAVSQRQTRDSFQPITWVVRRPLERVSPPVPCSHHSLICNLILAVSIPSKKIYKMCRMETGNEIYLSYFVLVMQTVLQKALGTNPQSMRGLRWSMS